MPESARPAIASGTATAAASGTERWRVHLRLGRVSNLPTVWSNVLAGAALATVAPPAAGSVLLLAVALSLIYIAGMYLNDAFDREVDAVERPERPIPADQIAARSVFIWGFTFLFAGWQLIVLHELGRPEVGTAAPVAAAVLAGAIVLYDARHKGNAFGPALMGACRGLVYITAALAVAGTVSATVVAGAIVLFAYTIGLTSIAKQETRGSGSHPPPDLPLGGGAAGRSVHRLWPVLLVLAVLAYGVPAADTAMGAALYAVFVGWTLYSFRLLRRRGAVGRVVISLIAGMSLLDAVLIARAGLPATGAVAALGFPLTLFFQRYIRGT